MNLIRGEEKSRGSLLDSIDLDHGKDTGVLATAQEKARQKVRKKKSKSSDESSLCSGSSCGYIRDIGRALTRGTAKDMGIQVDVDGRGKRCKK